MTNAVLIDWRQGTGKERNEEKATRASERMLKSTTEIGHEEGH